MTGERTDPEAVARIRAALEREGALTGAELLEATGLEVFRLWRTCLDEDDLAWRVVGRRYLRLDRAVDGYARLSPSIKREFLTYTVVARSAHADELERRAEALLQSARAISREKELLARVRLRGVFEEVRADERAADALCMIIAGDVVYDMAHAVDRPEPSTGKMVRGSDLDVVVITRDGTPADLIEELDRTIHREKYQLLTHPTYREEIDYIIKPLEKVRAQIRFDTFEHMVASKILHEGRFLLGSRAFFDELKQLLRGAGVPSKLASMERDARAYRLDGEVRLKGLRGEPTLEDLQRFFYTKEEVPEIY